MNTDTPFRESTKPLLRPHQVEDIGSEQQRLQEMLDPGQPSYLRAAVQNRNQAANQLRRISRQLDNQVPRPYEGASKDAAVAREKELREEILQGMPTQAEMRRAPAGAVDKHRAWEERIKPKMMEWKNIRLRLHAGGDIPGLIRNARDVANFEMFRPGQSSQELNMHNELIPGKTFHMPPDGAGPVVVFTDEEMAYLKSLAPDVALRLAILPNDVRGQALEIVRAAMEKEGVAVERNKTVKVAAAQPVKKAKRNWTPEQRQKQRDRMLAMRAKKEVEAA